MTSHQWTMSLALYKSFTYLFTYLNGTNCRDVIGTEGLFSPSLTRHSAMHAILICHRQWNMGEKTTKPFCLEINLKTFTLSHQTGKWDEMTRTRTAKKTSGNRRHPDGMTSRWRQPVPVCHVLLSVIERLFCSALRCGWQKLFGSVPTLLDTLIARSATFQLSLVTVTMDELCCISHVHVYTSVFYYFKLKQCSCSGSWQCKQQTPFLWCLSDVFNSL